MKTRVKSTTHTDVQIHAQAVCSNGIDVAIITASDPSFLSVLSTAARNSQCEARFVANEGIVQRSQRSKGSVSKNIKASRVT